MTGPDDSHRADRTTRANRAGRVTGALRGTRGTRGLGVVAVVATAAAVLAVGVGSWTALAGAGERSALATVSAFFEARHEGDCDRLAGLVSGSSWSGDDRPRPDRFVAACSRIVDRYRPRLRQAAVLSVDGDQALVRASFPVDDDMVSPADIRREEGMVVTESPSDDPDLPAALGYADGRLVREDGEWKVALDGDAFRLGRTATETVWGYAEAYRGGACDELAQYVSTAAWSEDGALDRDQLRAQCRATVDARRDAGDAGRIGSEPVLVPTPLITAPIAIEVIEGRRGDRTGSATAVVRWQSLPVETVGLVREGLEWRLTTSALEPVRYAGLAAHLVTEPLGLSLDPAEVGSGVGAVAPETVPPLVAPLDTFEGDDAPEQRRAAGFVRGLAGSFGSHPRRVDVLLYEFADAAGAAAYAEHLGGRVAGVATRYHDIPTIPVDGVPGGVALVTECAGASFRHASSPADCSRGNQAAAVAAHGRFVVGVEAVDYDGEAPTADAMRAQAVEVLQAQIARL